MHLLLAAQTVVTNPEGEPTVTGYILVALATGLSGAIIWALTALQRSLAAKAQLNAIWATTAKLAELVTSVVAHVLDGMSADFKRALADGRVTPEERRDLTDKAVALAKVALQERGLRSLEGVFGVAAEGATAYLAGLVSRAVQARVAAAQPPALAVTAAPSLTTVPTVP